MLNTKLSADERKAQMLILAEIDKALDLLQTHLQKYCDEVAPEYIGQKATSVPMVYIANSIKIIKENYRKGAEEPKESVKDRLKKAERA